MIKKRIDSLTIWQFENLSGHSEITHFVSTRLGGISNPPYNFLNLGFKVGDRKQNVLQNRKLLSTALNIPLDSFTTAQQAHGDNIAVVTEKMRGQGSTDYISAIPATDALITNIPAICLMGAVADCVPILLYDSRNKVVGAIHSGWQGTLKLITQKTVNMMIKKFTTNPAELAVGIGPSIGPCCYEVGIEIIDGVERVFGSKEDYITHDSHFSLWQANKDQMIKSGVPEENIEVAGICTKCHVDQFFSVRSAKGKTGSFGAGIMIREYK